MEFVLVFTNPSIHVDSVRPIVRVVLCDALERFIISISEAAPVISQDLALKAVNLITNPNRATTARYFPNHGEGSSY